MYLNEILDFKERNLGRKEIPFKEIQFLAVEILRWSCFYYGWPNPIFSKNARTLLFYDKTTNTASMYKKVVDLLKCK